MINYGVFVKKKMFNFSIYTNNALILATICLLVSEKAGPLKQKIDLRMVTSGNSNFAR